MGKKREFTLANDPVLPADLVEAGCGWLYRGDHTTSGSWELQFGPTIGSPCLGSIQHKQTHKGRRQVFEVWYGDPLANRAPVGRLGREYLKREAACEALYRHARKLVAKMIRVHLQRGGDG